MWIPILKRLKHLNLVLNTLQEVERKVRMAETCFLATLPTTWVEAGARPRVAYIEMSLLEP